MTDLFVLAMGLFKAVAADTVRWSTDEEQRLFDYLRTHPNAHLIRTVQQLEKAPAMLDILLSMIQTIRSQRLAQTAA